MKKLFFILLFLSLFNCCFAADGLLSKQATAFYSDNNRQKTMDLILQINEKERSAQDWLLLGNVFEDNGETDNAIFMYKKAIETDHKYYKAYYNLANIYALKGQLDLSIENYKKAIKYKYDNPYTYYNLACVYITKEEYAKARSALNKAIMYKSDVPEFHYNLAYVYQKLNNKKFYYKYMYNYKQLTQNS